MTAKSNSQIENRLVLCVFAAALIAISVFHEPWLDEAQAWQIARCASLHDILFEIPHYEGHPPLWHLILMLPARLGVPYEWGLKAVGFVFSIATVALILFRSPFPRAVKWALPFSYFLFYQYSVVVRPYCVMMLLLCLLADVFPKRDEHPWRVALLLALLCGMAAYGIVIAGGIAAVWLFERLCRHKAGTADGSLLRDRSLHAMAALLTVAVCLLLMICPRPDTYAATDEGFLDPAPMLTRFIAFFCSLIPEVTLTENTWFVYAGTAHAADFPLASVVSSALLTLVLGAALYLFSAKNHFRYLAVPYLFFTAFASLVYLSPHHVGIIALLLLFWCWNNLKTGQAFYGWKQWAERRQPAPDKLRLLRRCSGWLLALIMIIPIVWSGVAAATDIGTPYAYSRDAAAFMKAHRLDQLSVMAAWSIDVEEEPQANTNHLAGTNLFPYFERNFIFNFNDGRDDRAFLSHRKATEEENERHYAQWKRQGLPDVVLGEANLTAVYGRDASLYADYAPVYDLDYWQLWKSSGASGRFQIFVKRSRLSEYGLTEIPPDAAE
ncbi:MAG: hypothetical protein IKI63_00285 [Clostridia bacterium]|nr:hypothetical protein [Clostridia bacterium]